MAKTFEQRRRI